MKRVFAFVVMLVSLAFVAGRTLSPRTPSRPIVVKAPDVHLNLPEQPPMEQPQGWRERHQLLVDPYILLVVTGLSAIASGFFAGLTWHVNTNQADLLDQQTALLESQALPLFTVEHLYEWNDERQPTEHWLILSNEGGLARNVTLAIDTTLTLVFEVRGGRDVYVTHIAVDDYADDSPEYIPKLSDQPARLGEWSNASALRINMDKVLETLSNRSSLRYKSGAVEWGITIRYQDYQGNNRTEHYLYEPRITNSEGTLIDPLHRGGNGVLSAISPEAAETRDLEVEANRNQGLVMDRFVSSEDFAEVLLKEIEARSAPRGMTNATLETNTGIQLVLYSRRLD